MCRSFETDRRKRYVDKLKQDGMRNFIKYGIACFKKDCKVVIVITSCNGNYAKYPGGRSAFRHGNKERAGYGKSSRNHL